MTETEEIQTNPLNYLKVFFRRKELIFVFTFVGLVLGVCSGIVLPKQYQSSTTLLIEESKSDNPLFEKLAISTTVRQRLSTIRESMLSWNSLVKLVKRLNLDRDVETRADFEELIKEIRENVLIAMSGHNIIHLSYTSTDPIEAHAIVKNIKEIFVDRNKELQSLETSDAIIFIEEQLKVYRGKIKSTEIAKYREQLEALLIDSTEAHPQVRQLREQIEAREMEFKKENLIYTKTEALNASTTNPIIQEIKKALNTIEGTEEVPNQAVTQTDDPQKEYYKLLLIDKLDNVMARDVRVNSGIYNMLLQRLETAKITQRLQASKEGTRYTELNPPRVPTKPIKPNKILLVFIGLIAGAGSGIGLVFGLEFLDKSFIDVEDAKQYLGTPLLGAISKITTEDSLAREKERLRWLYSLTIIGGVIVIILTMAIRNFLQF